MSIKKSLFCMLTVSLMIVSHANAQRDSIRVRVFDGSGQEFEAATPKTISSDKNYVNFNPYLLLRGAFVIGYEHMLHDKHSLGVEAGLTYRDFVFEFGDAAFEDDDSNKFGREGVKAEVGRYLSVNYKFYPKDYNDFDGGLYLSPGFISRTYKMNYEVEYYDGLSYRYATINGNYSFTDYSFKMGYCRESWFFDDVITDIYFGAGARKRVVNSHEVVQSSLTSDETIVRTSETTNVPALYLGIKIGFTF